MKKLIYPFLFIIFLAACNKGPYYPPEGVWRSEEPNIILYIKPEYLSTAEPNKHPGVYTTVDGDEIKVFTRFSMLTPMLEIFDLATAFHESGGILWEANLFAGSYRLINNQLRFTAGRNPTNSGPIVIIFHRLEEYDPINPNDWFPN